MSNQDARKGRFATGVIYKKNDGAFAGKKIFVRFKRLAFREATQDNAISPHLHLDYELILLCKGSYRTKINQAEITLAPGGGVLIAPGNLHEDRRMAGARFIGLAFTLESDTDTPVKLLADNATPEQQKFTADIDRSEMLMRQIEEQNRRGGEFTGPVLDALAAALFWQILERLPAKALSPQFLEQSDDGNFKDKLTRILQQHLGETVDLCELAVMLGISRTSLVNKCKTLFQLPPGKVFTHLKMEHARHLLANSTLSVKEIAGRLGYASEFAFSRAFRRDAGCAPRIWRCNYIFEK